jgi:non-specific serine/threonine protein kinase
LKTLYTDKPSNYDTIKKIRLAKDLTLKPCPYIRESVKLRNYQIIGALHFLLLNRMILADSAGLGKTIQSVVGYAYLKQKNSELKLLISCPKSAMDQWQEEIEKFTTGISVHVLDNSYGKVKDQEIYGWPKELREQGYKIDTLTGFEARRAQYNTVKKDVLIVGYFPIQQDYKFIIENRSPEYVYIMDEAQEIKNLKASRHLGAEKISQQAKCVYGLSATVIKNRLEEAYNIYRVIVPGLFGGTTSFYRDFCIRKPEKISRHGSRVRKIMRVVGYKNLDKFREKLDPYFLMRKTRDVASDLPNLSCKKVILEMTEAQSRLYKQALNGDIYRREIKRKFFEFQEYMQKTQEPSEKDHQKYAVFQKRYDESLTEVGLQNSKMAALSYCQLASNGPGWLRGEEGESSKETEFKRLFEQELFSEKVIVFSRFKSGIHRLEKIMDDLGLKHVKITGDDDKEDRKKARLDFSDLEKDINAIFITQAGSAALNLQAANVVLFYDTPWSYGDLYQTIGRAQRIGSLYSHIHLIHMINKKTIDEHVLKILYDKKDLINNVIGDYAEGTLEFDNSEVVFKDEESSIDALFHSVFSSAV